MSQNHGSFRFAFFSFFMKSDFLKIFTIHNSNGTFGVKNDFKNF